MTRQQHPPRTIHFVCSGNTFRSRMAETYLNAKKTNLSASSSGTNAGNSSEGMISWFAQRILQYNKIAEFAKPRWNRTTKRLLNKADFVVFFGRKNYEHCKKKYGYQSKNFAIWEISDLTPYGYTPERPSPGLEKKLMEVTENIFQQITRKVDQLARKLNKVALLQ